MPKSRDLKSVRFEMKLSPAEHKEWSAAALSSRRALAQWVRDACNAAYVEQMK